MIQQIVIIPAPDKDPGMLQLHFTVEYKKPEEQQHGNDCRGLGGRFHTLPSQQCDTTPLQTTAGAIGYETWNGTGRATGAVQSADDIWIDR